MEKISVIVPIYNVEEYLPSCINSILNQTFKNFELILVNDGSTDGSGLICDSYAKKDTRIRVFHQKNKGVSAARNAGIELSEGEYLAFVDPDDTIQPTMYETLMDYAIKYKVDMVVCPIKTIYMVDNKTSVSAIWRDVNTVLDKNMIEKYLITGIVSGKTYSLVSSVNKLYRKDVLIKNKIKFDENMSHSEDARLNFTLITLINSLVYIDQPLYNYYRHERSSLTQVFREDLYEYITDNKTFLINLCKQNNLDGYIEFVIQHFTTVTLSYLQEIVSVSIPKSKKNKLVSNILLDSNFIGDLRLYRGISNYYKLIKYICLIRNTSVLIYTIALKIKFQRKIGVRV